MPYVSKSYENNPNAMIGTWVCSPASDAGPFDDLPEKEKRRHPDYCGQCVSYVRTVCPDMPTTKSWKRGAWVKNSLGIEPGTAIATFSYSEDTNLYFYEGHAAIYVKQDKTGIYVYDQWVNGVPSPIHARLIRWHGKGVANNGDSFYVVE